MKIEPDEQMNPSCNKILGTNPFLDGKKANWHGFGALIPSAAKAFRG